MLRRNTCMTYYLCVFSATVRLLLHSNSAINVWVYGYRLREFRETFKHDCLRLPCCRSTCCRTCRCYCCQLDTDINDCQAAPTAAAISNRNSCSHVLQAAADDGSSRDANLNEPASSVDDQSSRERFSDLVSDSGIVTGAALTNTQ